MQTCVGASAHMRCVLTRRRCGYGAHEKRYHYCEYCDTPPCFAHFSPPGSRCKCSDFVGGICKNPSSHPTHDPRRVIQARTAYEPAKTRYAINYCLSYPPSQLWRLARSKFYLGGRVYFPKSRVENFRRLCGDRLDEIECPADFCLVRVHVRHSLEGLVFVVAAAAAATGVGWR